MNPSVVAVFLLSLFLCFENSFNLKRILIPRRTTGNSIPKSANTQYYRTSNSVDTQAQVYFNHIIRKVDEKCNKKGTKLTNIYLLLFHHHSRKVQIGIRTVFKLLQFGKFFKTKSTSKPF